MEAFIVAKFTELLSTVTSVMKRPPARVIALVPGTSVVWDDCENGQLTGRLAAMTPVSSKPVQRCGIDYWRATGELTLLRCALTQDDRDEHPRRVTSRLRQQRAWPTPT